MKIEKCPFCGGEAKITARDVEPQGDPWYGKNIQTFVICTNCGACLFDDYFHDGFTDEREAIAAWNRRAEPENEPLTTSELRKMDGEPVYVITLDNPLENQPYWAIAGINSNDSRHQNGVALYNRVQGDWGAFDLYGKTWLAYRYKPERSEGE